MTEHFNLLLLDNTGGDDPQTSGAGASYQPQGQVESPQDFMKNFDSRKITNPGQLPFGYENGKDPYWYTGQTSGPPQLIDPTGNRSIAYYCYQFHGM